CRIVLGEGACRTPGARQRGDRTAHAMARRKGHRPWACTVREPLQSPDVPTPAPAVRRPGHRRAAVAAVCRGGTFPRAGPALPRLAGAVAVDAGPGAGDLRRRRPGRAVVAAASAPPAPTPAGARPRQPGA